jgi:hypothetical protein
MTSLAIDYDKECNDLVDYAQSLTYKEAIALYHLIEADPSFCDHHKKAMCKGDRYYLLTQVLGAKHAYHPWIFERCREVENNTDGYLDLWARGHYKSFIITYAGAIQEILRDQDITILILSHTGRIAKDFLSQIKQSLETNQELIRLFPETLWENVRKAPKWSLDTGLVVKRTSSSKEPTVYASGLVDGQPTSKHFRLRIYDDVVTLESVSTPDQIAKTTYGWEMSQNLGSTHGDNRVWHIGTRYSYGDTWQTLIERQAVKARVYAATDDGTINGKPIFLSQEAWDKKLNDESTFTIACQQLQNPSAGGEQEFKPEWLRNYEIRPKNLNVYILGDYAGSKKAGSSNTALLVVGVDHAMNKYILDGVCHKLSLTERWITLRNLRRRWINQPGIQHVKVGYEKFGAQSDIEHFESQMKIENEHFAIEELSWPREGDVSKDSRIRRLEPDFRNWRFFIPYSGEMTSMQRDAKERGQEYLISRPIKKKDHENKIYDVIEWFVKREFLFFPNTTYKDFMDALSRIYDIGITAPIIYDETDLEPEAYED